MDARRLFSEKSFESLVTTSQAFALQKTVINCPNPAALSDEIRIRALTTGYASVPVQQQQQQQQNLKMTDLARRSSISADGVTSNDRPASANSATSSQSAAGDARREPIRYPAMSVTTVKEKGGVFAKPKDRATVAAPAHRAAATAVSGLPKQLASLPGDASASAGSAVAAVRANDVAASGKPSDSHQLHTSFREVPLRDLDISVFNAEYNVSLDGRGVSSSAALAQPSPASTGVPASLSDGLQRMALTSGPAAAAASVTLPYSASAAAVLVAPAQTPPAPFRLSSLASAASSTGSLADVVGEMSWTVDASAYERLACEKANLEGRVEMLMGEAEAAMHERTQLQAELAAARLLLEQQQQQFQFMVASAAAGEVSAAALGSSASPASRKSDGDHERQQQRLQQLEVQAAHLQASADSSSAEARRLANDLFAANAECDRMREAAEAARSEAAARDRLVSELRATVDAARTEASSHGELRRRAEDEARLAQDELSGAVSARDWYQQQLHAAQETRAQLQTELTKLQNLSASQADSVERLRVENVQLKHQLNETQHKALTEKQLLMRHLEAIEADMVEREAGIDQIQREQNLTDVTTRQRLAQAEKERMQLGKLMASTSELERELQRVRHELSAARAEVDVLDGQRAELGRRLVSSQDELAARCRELEQLREAAMEMEARIKSMFKKDSEREARILRITEEKDNIEVALRSALEEKRAFSAAVEAVKANAAKVEANFKLIRQDLATKSRELEKALETSNRLQQELSAAAGATAAIQREHAVHSGTSAHVSYNAEAAVAATASFPLLATAPADTISQPLTATLVGRTDELDGGDLGMVTQLRTLSADLALAQQREQQAVAQRLALEQRCASMAEEHAAQLQLAAREASAGRAELEGQLYEVREQLEAATERRHAEGGAVNEALRKACDDLQTELAARTAELNATRQRLLEDHAAYQNAVSLLGVQLKDAVESRDRAFKELMSAADHDRARAPSSTADEQLLAQIKLLQADLSEARERKAELERALADQQAAARTVVEELRRRAAELEQLLAQTVAHSDEQQRRLADSYQRLLLELEKERGRLAGVRQHHDKLKEHARALEIAVARLQSSPGLAPTETTSAPKGSTDVAAEHRAAELARELEAERSRSSELDSLLRHERATAAELRAQLMQDLEASNTLKQQLDAARSELRQLKRDAERKTTELATLAAELENAKQAESRLALSVQALQNECRAGRLEADQLRRAVAEAAARAPIISDEIKALHWQIKQKSKEAYDLENQLRLTESRLQLETDNLKKALTMSNTDIETHRLELSATRKEKFSYQAKVGELRGALKTIVQHVKTGVKDHSLDVEHFEKIIEDTAVPSYKSKPLQNLKSCLASLQTEMQLLQQQMGTAQEQPTDEGVTAVAQQHNENS